ncbi:mitochondrial K+-H+ exchange-related-domain-containing protein [Dichotomocladium elegans]|nr:mitochondrial K+-H+ exchange-related-domain-containing protein [Dichotomocladium elegans]
MRVFAVPILRNRWAYYCHSNIASASRLTQVVDWSSKKWDQLGAAEPDTWKRKLYDRGNYFMNQLDYQEWFLKNVPTKEDTKEDPLEKVHVFYAPMLDGTAVKADLEELLNQREPYHKKYMLYSAYWVPVACTFVIVPLIPNIPLAYNLFRLYSHYKAFKGVQHLRSLPLDYVASAELEQIFETTKLVTDKDVELPSEVKSMFKESKRPNLQILLQRDVPGVIELDTIAQLSRHFDSPGMEMELKRARYQMLAEIAKHRFKNDEDPVTP